MFKAIKKGYGNLKLQTKFFLIILLAVAIPMIILAATLSSRLYRMITSDTIREEQTAAAQSAPLISDALDEVTDLSDLIRSYTFYRRLFSNTLYEPLPDMLQSEDAENFQARIEKSLRGNTTSAVRIYIDLPADDKAFQNLKKGSVFASLDEVRTTYWRGIFYSSHPSALFCPSFYLGSRERRVLGDCAYIRPASIRDASGTITTCYLALYFNSTTLQNILIRHQTQQGSVSYITNDRDAMITSTDPSLAGIYYMNYDSIRQNLMNSNGFLEREVLGETVYVGSYYLSDADWFLVTVTPSKPLREETAKIAMEFFLIWLVAAVVSILLAFLLSHSLTRRISAVSEQMTRVKSGLPIPMASPEERDEIGDLVDSYNYMARQINHLVAEQQKSAEELRIAEFNTLQAQINPHFLYNTMEMINWMAQQGRTAETNQAIRDLSRFYKLTLSKKSSISTIESEIEHVTIYCRLQNMRFENGIDFVVDVPDTLMEYRIPRLTLQPIVENAILHGILEKESRRGTIVLTGWLDGHDVVLLISDDGVGMPKARLDQLLTGNLPGNGNGNHIAVYNTHRRLQILYGNDYGLTYRSTEGKGTEVEIRFPAYTESQNTTLAAKAPVSKIPRVEGDTVSVPFAEEAAAALNQNRKSPSALVQFNNSIVRERYRIHALHEIFHGLPENQDIYILSHLVTQPFPVHTHDYYEINYLCSGTLKNIVDGNEIYMYPGSMLLMNKKAFHAMEAAEGDPLVINICFNDTYMREILGEIMDENNLLGSFLRGRTPYRLNYLFYPFGHITQIQEPLSKMIQLYADQNYHTSQQMDVLMYNIFKKLADCAPENNDSQYRRSLI